MTDQFISGLLDFAPVWSTFPPYNNETYSNELYLHQPMDFLFYNDTDSLLMQELDPFWSHSEDMYGAQNPNSDSPPVTPTSPLSKVIRRNTRVGYCEHPKHDIYRRPDYQLSPPACQHQIMQECQGCRQLCDHHHLLRHQQEGKGQDRPRRGRPPKGTKPSEKLYPDTMNEPIAMTTRPLPKRLEAVVGVSNLYVCLTCLKRSDLDIDYLAHPAYIGPQSTKKRNIKP